MNPATALATVLAGELVRCGLTDVVLAPGSRSAPLALAFFALAHPSGSSGADGTGGDGADAHGAGDGGAGPGGPALRLHVRIDERSAAFLALGLAKASRRPVAVLCTSGTAAANFHPAVIEAGESGVPLLVLTADRPPELRGTGANQAIDQLNLYGGAVRWFCDAGVPEARAGMNAYWRSLACRAWAHAAGLAGGDPGPVQLNLPLRDPLVPTPDAPAWPEPLAGRPRGAPWTSFPPATPAGGAVPGGTVELPWAERGVVVCGDGDYDAGPLLALAAAAGWPVLAEPSSGARRGPHALRAYPSLLATPEFAAAHVPEVVVSAGRPGLTRGQLALLRGGPGGPARHVVIAQGPGRWADPARTATDVAGAVRLSGAPQPTPGSAAWLASWRRADASAARAADQILDAETRPAEPRLARDLAAALPSGALLWAASSLPVRDLDQQMAPRDGLRVLASRGASGIDGLISAATGAALAHPGGPAFALLGDLAFLHDAPGLFPGPGDLRPDLCLVVVNNDGGGIFSTLEAAAFEASFERVFGTPHGADLEHLARAAGLPYTRLTGPAGLPAALRAGAGGLRVVEMRTRRDEQAALRARLTAACTAAVRESLAGFSLS